MPKGGREEVDRPIASVKMRHSGDKETRKEEGVGLVASKDSGSEPLGIGGLASVWSTKVKTIPCLKGDISRGYIMRRQGLNPAKACR